MDGNHLEFVGDISSRAQQELDDIEVTIGTRQWQHGVIISTRGLVHIGTCTNQPPHTLTAALVND